jgi:hypothetical protein
MTSQEKLLQARSTFQQGLQQLEDQHLEYVMGTGPKGVLPIMETAPFAIKNIVKREVHPEPNGTHPNNGTYIPPTDPAIHDHLRALSIDPSKIPGNISYTLSQDEKTLIMHKRPSY